MTVLPDRTMAGRSQKVLLPRRIQISGIRSSTMGTGRAAPLAAPSSAERSTIRRSYNFRADSLENISSPTCAPVGFVCWTLPTIRRVILRPKFRPPLIFTSDRMARFIIYPRRRLSHSGDAVAGDEHIDARACGNRRQRLDWRIYCYRKRCKEGHRSCDWSVTVAAWSNRCAGHTTLELHAANGALLQSNDNWRDDPGQASQIIATGLAPSSNLESAIIATLQPGNYTAIVRGKNSRQGIALAEV